MAKKNKFDELVQKLQEGKIGHLQLVMNTPEMRDDFINWYKERQLTPDDACAQYWLENVHVSQSDIELLEHETHSIYG